MMEMFHPLKWIDEFNQKHSGWAKAIKIVFLIFVYLFGFFTNIILANGIVSINHYILKNDYEVNVINVAPQYYSPSQKNFTVIVNNKWSSDLPTKIDVHSEPSNNGITFDMMCDNALCQNVISVDKQSFKLITVVMTINDKIEQPISICVKASESSNEKNTDSKCLQSYIMSQDSSKKG